MNKKYEVEYFDDVHKYLVNGVIVPSVTEILEKIFPNKYKNVPRETLMRKATYGTIIHNYIEQYEKGLITQELNYIQEASFRQYLKLKDKYNIEVLEQEKIVNYKDIYAGRFDIYGEVNGVISLCDIKTTASVDKEYLKYQLNLYRFASKDKNKIKKLYAIWLAKKDIGKLVEIEIMSDKEIEKLLKKVEEIWK